MKNPVETRLIGHWLEIIKAVSLYHIDIKVYFCACLQIKKSRLTDKNIL
jgi:hypothetical protein